MPQPSAFRPPHRNWHAGSLGIPTSEVLVRNGYKVLTWSKSVPRELPAGVAAHYAGSGPEGLPAFLAALDICLVLLPLVPESQHIISKE